MAELDGGQVDGDRHHDKPLVLPFLELAAGFAHDPAANGGDEAAGLRESDELVGPHQAAFGGAPAHQGFDALQRAIGQAHLGLVVQIEGGVGNGFAQQQLGAVAVLAGYTSRLRQAPSLRASQVLTHSRFLRFTGLVVSL